MYIHSDEKVNILSAEAAKVAFGRLAVLKNVCCICCCTYTGGFVM